MARNGRFRRFIAGEQAKQAGRAARNASGCLLSLPLPWAAYTFFFDASSQNTWDKRGGTDVQPGADGHRRSVLGPLLSGPPPLVRSALSA